MSPSKPGDPSQGRPAADEQQELEAAESREALAEQAAPTAGTGPEPEPGRSEREVEPEAEGTAAAVTGVEKGAAGEARRADGRAQSQRPAPHPGGRPAEPAGPVVRAHARYVRSSARKARLVSDHLRGKSVDEARAILAYSPRSVARDWAKVLESAIANAEHNHELVGDDLRVLRAVADEGPTIKRFRPRAQGRATRIRKRTSHLTIMLTPKE
jgi:ribosomal protein L22